MERVYSATEWCARIALAAQNVSSDQQDPKLAARLFIGGDRSQVGKSSVCLAILSSLVERLGFKAHEVAYIKPATQCESTQLVTKYCANRGIDCVPIGPVVYVSGFTREFLLGNTKSSEEMAKDVEDAVNKLASRKGRRLVIVDGVGFPAVGSIVGLSNAQLAKSSSAPVILVCPKGVGNAVDSFNLNRVFFEHHGVKVLGAFINRLPLDGFYSREKCKESIDLYFDQYQKDKRIYGYLPELPELVDASPPPDKTGIAPCKLSESWVPEDEVRLIALLDMMEKYGDVRQLVDDLLLAYERILYEPSDDILQANAVNTPAVTSSKRPRTIMSIEDIRKKAKAEGARSGG